MLKFIAKIFIFVSIFAVFNPSYADDVVSFYDVDVLVAGKSTSVRTQAFKQGLDEMFIRISGDSGVMSKIKRPLPSRYVKQFSYSPVSKPRTDAKGVSLTHNLKIQYNGSSMTKYLLDNGLPIWDNHRPAVVVWLVVRDGKNEYVLKGSDKSLLKAATDKSLTRRGIPERWPVYDSKDKQLLSVSDIRGGFRGPVMHASKRYSKGPALTGSIIWNGKRWQSNWDLMTATDNRHWSLDNADYGQLINTAIDRVADALGVIYAVQNKPGNQQLTTVELEVPSITSVEKYRYIENYLVNLRTVKKAKPLTIDTESVVFEVDLRGSEKDFLNSIRKDAAFSKATVRTADLFSPRQTGGGSTLDPDSNNTGGVVVPAPSEQTPDYRYKIMQ